MKLKDLIDLIDYNRESENKIQIVYPDGDWNDYDEFKLCSPFLVFFEKYDVTEIDAVADSLIRVAINMEQISNTWIPADMRLPKENKEYLIRTATGGVMVVGYYNGLWNANRHSQENAFPDGDVVAWMPIPKYEK